MIVIDNILIHECPKNMKLKKFLVEKFDVYDSEDEVSYDMWVSTDRTQRATFHVTLEENMLNFENVAAKSLKELTPQFLYDPTTG